MIMCPAQTGTTPGGCERFPDFVHRCKLPDYHAREGEFGKTPSARAMHHCECGHGWTCLTGSLDDLFDLLTPRGRGDREEQDDAGAAGTGR